MSRYNFPPLPYGDTLQSTITYLESDGETPIDLSNYTALMQVFDDEGLVILSLTDTDGLTLGGAAGTITIYSPVTEGTGSPIMPGCYSYFLRLTSTGTEGEVSTTILEGCFTITSPGQS